jgi:hypothetical protein
MQPYLFPYIGYFQLIYAVDKFVAYDDVAFIKQGWINRNNILLNNNRFLFTIPLVNASSYALICDTQVNYKMNWQPKFLKTIEQAYKKAPQFEAVYPLIVKIINKEHTYVSELAADSLIEVSNYLGISTAIQPSSKNYGNNDLKGQERVIDICKREGADHYINPIGGTELYSKEDFESNGIKLDFVKTLDITYPQFKDPFVPWLSIIDVLMFNSVEQTINLINRYELV